MMARMGGGYLPLTIIGRPADTSCSGTSPARQLSWSPCYGKHGQGESPDEGRLPPSEDATCPLLLSWGDQQVHLARLIPLDSAGLIIIQPRLENDGGSKTNISAVLRSKENWKQLVFFFSLF